MDNSKDTEIKQTKATKGSITALNKVRTDLALEVRETFKDDDVEIKGVILKEDYDKKKNIKVTTVEIKDQKGAEAMGKPIGTYITIEASRLGQEDESFHEPITKEIAKYIKMLAGDIDRKEVLVAGLGNREVTPDALGPQVVNNLFVTRHFKQEFGQEFLDDHHMGNVSAISPGVMAQTGMETSEILRGVVRETMPKLVIVIDALAARSITRLNKTVQITDTGISPGSGVGNNRKALNKESLGVDVIALGVPTVVDAATIVNDTMEQFMLGQGFSDKEIGQFTSELAGQSMNNMFVTPKNIDESIKRISFTISEALNKCFA
ncbi:germination protease [Anaerocolumna cellulosilytica]|uniref:Germination protease n=1 Tax=Anaerocolumna cellulosilytica TaxID=433286 RepID=A0A6S6R6N8_9FIRM|nr:GPR endopeptidase [Anaerocolumna cellulosilytica]MBB5193829.1 spore protease [Anaerocolumna cellulosilytica]BCJ94955.1 germination protease [Anaerocolumna cellulosilytica]